MKLRVAYKDVEADVDVSRFDTVSMLRDEAIRVMQASMDAWYFLRCDLTGLHLRDLEERTLESLTVEDGDRFTLEAGPAPVVETTEEVLSDLRRQGELDRLDYDDGTD
jgi:hypothetical protein